MTFAMDNVGLSVGWQTSQASRAVTPAASSAPQRLAGWTATHEQSCAGKPIWNQGLDVVGAAEGGNSLTTPPSARVGSGPDGTGVGNGEGNGVGASVCWVSLRRPPDDDLSDDDDLSCPESRSSSSAEPLRAP